MTSEPEYRAYRSFPPLIDPATLPAGPVVVVAPHPDDEIIGCGGAMALHSSRGDPVTVLHMTGGESGDPDGLQGDQLTEVRHQESQQAAEDLGVSTVVSLGFPDGGVETSTPVIERLREELSARQPVLVYAPSPLECHPDHLATCWVTARALAGAEDSAARLCMYEINHPTLASWLLDVTPYIDLKRTALSRFKSQQVYQDIIGKCLAGAYARTVNIPLPGVDYAEAFLEVAPEHVPEVWDKLHALSRRLGIDLE